MKIQKHSVFSSLRSLLLDEQLLWQLNRICSMVTLDMRYCALEQWFSNYGTRTTSGTRCAVKWYAEELEKIKNFKKDSIGPGGNVSPVLLGLGADSRKGVTLTNS